MRGVLVRQFGPVAQARFTELDEPAAGPGDVVVDVAAAEIGFADMLMIEGKYQRKPALPFVPGTNAAGTVVAVGDGVEWPRIGDKVAVHVPHGAFAERVRARAEHCFAIPARMGFEEAAAIGLSYQTAYFALTERARVRPGASVLVLGAAGGVGIAAVQVARALGAALVIGTVRGNAATQVAATAGCDHVIDTESVGLGDGFRDLVLSHSGERGVDIVVDPVGGETTGAALRCVAWSGTLVVVGFAAGEIPMLKANYLLLKNIAVAGLQWTDYLRHAPDLVRRTQQKLFELLGEGVLRPQVSGTFAFDQFVEAFEKLRTRSLHGKVLLVNPDRRLP